MGPPDIAQHNTDPEYCAALIERSGLTQVEISRRLGIADRALRAYKDTGQSGLPMPYLVQYALECLPKAR